MNTELSHPDSSEHMSKTAIRFADDMSPVDYIQKLFNNWKLSFEDEVVDYLEQRQSDLSIPEKLSLLRLFEDYMDNDDEFLRKAIAKSLFYVVLTDLSIFKKLLDDSDELVRCEALESFVKVAGTKAVDKVLEKYKSDASELVRLIALRQLSMMNNKDYSIYFMEALKSNFEEIYLEGCVYLANRNNRKTYRFLRQKYIRTNNRFARICLSYALYCHGEKDKLKKIFSGLRAKGSENISLREAAAILLDEISARVNNKIKKLILKTLHEALTVEKVPSVIENIIFCIENIKADLKAI